MSRPLSPGDAALQGHYAGIVSRAVSFAVDALIIVVVFDIATHAVEYFVTAVIGVDFHFSDHPVVADTAFALWAFTFIAYGLSHGGRTIGMVLLGLRAVRADGADLGTWRAVVRTLLLPISLAFLVLAYLPLLVGRQRRAFHDHVAGTAVVYSWDVESAHFRSLARHRSTGAGPPSASDRT